MRIEAIHHQVPFDGLGVGCQQMLQMPQIICFCAGLSHIGCRYSTLSHIKTGNQRLGAMADVLKFSSFSFSGTHGLIGCLSFERLNPSHLIG
jgi:hypothetical protein